MPILKVNDTYSFILSENLFCDYFMVKDELKEINKDNKQEDLFVLNNFDLIARGGLLKYTQLPWLDEFKLKYEEALMPVILPQVQKVYDSGDYKKALEITRIVLSIDPFNAEAIKYKLKALRRIKGIEYARAVYDEFIIEYKRSLDVDYPISFDKICSNKTERQ